MDALTKTEKNKGKKIKVSVFFNIIQNNLKKIDEKLKKNIENITKELLGVFEFIKKLNKKRKLIFYFYG